uniref:Uncharacterized protein n=1 Tax=Myoviridae sp. ctkfK18 TaxID=2825165 RepID=A0A8S5VH59_9CAUD|nr:MAG TPA: hypothetical protein [Myoviridae sp. ctkfK18]
MLSSILFIYFLSPYFVIAYSITFSSVSKRSSLGLML